MLPLTGKRGGRPQVVEQEGRLDVLINNAGIMPVVSCLRARPASVKHQAGQVCSPLDEQTSKCICSLRRGLLRLSPCPKCELHLR